MELSDSPCINEVNQDTLAAPKIAWVEDQVGCNGYSTEAGPTHLQHDPRQDVLIGFEQKTKKPHREPDGYEFYEVCPTNGRDH